MMSYNDISNYLSQDPPDLIYLSIGCAQIGNTVSNEQQVPPFIKAMPGRIAFILIDPALESPPQAFADLGFPPTQVECPCIHRADRLTPGSRTAAAAEVAGPITIHGRFDVIILRQKFKWTRDMEKSFIDDLCAIALNPTNDTRLIVQDFSGENIHKYYPLRAFGPVLLERVIFDATHGDGGCHAPWAHGEQPQFQNSRTGGFVHAWNQRMTDIRGHVPDSVYKQQLSLRVSLMTNYAHRLYHIQAGTHEPRIWCTPEIAMSYISWLFDTYDCLPGTDNTSLTTLMVEVYKDIAVAEGHPVLDARIDAPYGEYYKALRAAINPTPI